MAMRSRVPAKSLMAVRKATLVCGRKPATVVSSRRCMPSDSLAGRSVVTGLIPSAPVFIGIYFSPLLIIDLTGLKLRL